MNCFYRILLKSALLVFLLCCFGLQYSEACISPKPTIQGKDTVCENSGETYRLNPTPDNQKFTINVIVGNGIIILKYLDYSEIKWNKPGPTFIRYIYTDKDGCSDSVTKQIFVKPSDFQFDAGPDMHVCHNDTVVLGLPPIKNMTYKWYDLRFTCFACLPDYRSSSIRMLARGISTQAFTINYKVYAKDTITGCSYIDTVKLIIYPRYKTNITGETGCVNDSTTYVYSTDSLPPYAYWYAEGGQILSDIKSKSVLVKWNRIGKNRLQLRYFTGSCNDSTFIETALSAVKQPFYAGPDGTVCDGDTAFLGLPPIPNCAYWWEDRRYPHLGDISSTESYLKKKVFSPVKTRDFDIYYLVTMVDKTSGCRFYDTVKLTIKPRLKTNITGKVGCFNDIANFSTDTLPADAYWISEGGEIISDNKAKSILVKWNRNGGNTIKLRYNLNGCSDSAVYTVELDSLTHFPITGADSIFENTFHTYSVAELGNTVNKWNVTGGSIISETENTITVSWGNLDPNANIWSYKLNNEGCHSDTAFLPVTIKKRENLDLNHTFHVYPNPFLNNIMIAPVDDFAGEIKIVLSDMLGRKLLEQNAYIQTGKNALNWNVSAAGLKSGFYNISIIYPQGKSTWKLVRE